MNYPAAQEGTWTLIAPDGRKWEGRSPLALAGIENKERVPPEERLRRIKAAIDEPPNPCWCPYCGEPHTVTQHTADGGDEHG